MFMTLEAWALVWLAVQAREVQNESAAESVTQFVPNLGACNMQSNFSLLYLFQVYTNLYATFGDGYLIYCT